MTADDPRRLESFTKFIHADCVSTENEKEVSTNLAEYTKFCEGPVSPSPIVSIRDVAVSDDKAYFYWKSQKPKAKEPFSAVEIRNSGFSVWTFNAFAPIR